MKYPKPLVAGQIYRINIRMNEIDWALPASHRLCLSLSNAYWPLVWPSPRRSKLAVHLEKCQLHLSARADLNRQMFTGRKNWHVTSDIHSTMWSDENWFYMTAKIKAKHCADVVFKKSWDTRTPRVFL
jgi:hypothetical protein